MGTNFYGVGPHGRVHLGQSAIGWEFMFQGDEDRCITGIQSWLQQLDELYRIEDEYGNVWTRDQLLEYIEARRGKKPRDTGPRCALSAWARSREFRDEGCFFAYYQFS